VIPGTEAFSKTIKELTGLVVHLSATIDDTNSKTLALCVPGAKQKYKDMNTEPLSVNFGGGQTGYIHFATQVKYLGDIIHHDLASDQSVHARIQAACVVMGAIRKALSCRYMEKHVRGKVLVATVLTVLLYSSECWVLTAELRRVLATFWNDCCRFALGTNRIDAQLRGIHNVDVHRQLGVHDIHYYLRHRRLTWAGKMARMPMTRLPRQILTAFLRYIDYWCGTSSNGDDKNDADDSGESFDEEDEEVEDDVTGDETDDDEDEEEHEEEYDDSDGNEEAGPRINGDMGDVEAQHDDSGESFDEEDEEVEGDVSGDETNGDEEEEEHEEEYDDSDGNEEAGPRINGDMGDVEAQHGDSDSGGNDGNGEGHHWTVANAKTARSRCQKTKQLIDKGAPRFTHTTQRRAAGGKSVDRHFSVEGMIHILTKKETLRKKLAARILGIELMKPKDQKTVRLALDKKTVEEARRQLAPAKIVPPTIMPWTCNRCGKKYEQKMQCATQHVKEDKCKTKRKKRPTVPRGKPCKKKEHGHQRHLTWRANIHAVLRKTTKTTEICREKYDGCHGCHHQHKQCERCYFLEWMKVAQDPKEWDKIVYKTTDGDSVIGRRRQTKWDTPTEAWEDPRKDEEQYYGGLLHIAGRVRA
jgi:hypothetical protein